MTRRVTRGFDPAALRRAREEQESAALRRRAEVARLAGVGVATLQQWEAGKKSPTVDLLARVAEVLGVSMDALVPIPRDRRTLRDWRVLRGLLQPHLAQRAGMSNATLGRLESGEVALTDANAERLSTALDLPIAEVRDCYERARRRPPGEPV
ncbi:helix-turn-helix transcriptional regulator [Nocardia rhamnosiphila]